PPAWFEPPVDRETSPRVPAPDCTWARRARCNGSVTFSQADAARGESEHRRTVGVRAARPEALESVGGGDDAGVGGPCGHGLAVAARRGRGGVWVLVARATLAASVVPDAISGGDVEAPGSRGERRVAGVRGAENRQWAGPEGVDRSGHQEIGG